MLSALLLRLGTSEHWNYEGASSDPHKSALPERQGPGQSSRGPRLGSIAPAVVRAGPDERVCVAFFVLEEVGVDGRIEAWVVELEAQVLTVLVRLLRPGGANLGTTNQYAVAGSVFTAGAGVGDDAHVLGLNAEGDEFTGELVGAGLLEGADGSHVMSPLSVFEPAPCGLDGDRQAGSDWRRIACDRSTAEDSGTTRFLYREE